MSDGFSIQSIYKKSIIGNCSVPPLGEVRENFCAGSLTPTVLFTISPNPNTKHVVYRSLSKQTVKARKVKVPYKLMTLPEQKAYIDTYFQQVYRYDGYTNQTYYYTYELNSDKNVHIHGMLRCENIQEEIELEMFRKSVMTHPLTVYNLNKGTKCRDWMNNITFVNDIEGLNSKFDYSVKEYDRMKKHFPIETNI